MIVDTNTNTATTDASPDGSTVQASLMPNPTMLRYELMLMPALSTSLSLNNPGYDINSNSELIIDLLTFPLGDPEAINSIKFMGQLDGLDYDDVSNVINFRARPVNLTPSPTYPSGESGILVAYFSYAGNSQSDPGGQIDYGNTTIVSNFWIDDLGLPMHPSSADLIGSGFSVNGLPNSDVDTKLYARVSYARTFCGGRDPIQAGGYVDGFVPNAGFFFSAEKKLVDFSLTSQAEPNPGDNDVIEYSLNYNGGFSTRDFQFGYFIKPWLGSYLGTGGWLYLPWFGWVNPIAVPWAFHDELGWLYTPGSATYDNLIVYLQSIGWVYTSQSLFPYLYVFDYQGNAFWAFYFRETRAPNVFYRFDIQDFLFVP